MKFYTLQHHSKTLIATVLTVGLGLASINTAVASAFDSSPSFNDKYSDIFRHDTNPDYADFNDVFAFERNSNKGHSTLFASFEGHNSSHGFSNFNLFDERGHHSAYFSNVGYSGFGEHFAHFGEKSNSPYHSGIFYTNYPSETWMHWDCHTMINPVPEPSEYLLMLCGLGLIGFIAMKRKQGHGFSAA